MSRLGHGSESPLAPPAMTPSVAQTMTAAAPSARAGTPTLGGPRWGARRSWLWLIAAAGALALAGGALAQVDGGALLERMLAPLAAVQQPFLELATASRGDGPDGAEYVIFLREGADSTALTGFFREHPSVRYVSPGLLPGVAVVHIQGELGPLLTALRGQPPVRLVLKSRLGMVCH